MPKRQRPHSHREVARAIFKSEQRLAKLEGKHTIQLIPSWIKVELYVLFFNLLPHIVTGLVWAALILAIYWLAF